MTNAAASEPNLLTLSPKGEPLQPGAAWRLHTIRSNSLTNVPCHKKAFARDALTKTASRRLTCIYSCQLLRGAASEQTGQSRARRPGPADSESDRPRAHARLGHRPTHSTDLRQCPSCGPERALSIATQAGT